ncbi:MAG: methyltransferase domain-containing protein [Dehalococcoidia bacterium]|nr:methyltransferase domain-containing protein [Dehalococcoidia bacterium]
MGESAQPWYQAFFGQDYLDVYGNVFTAERAEQEVGFVTEALALTEGESVLDLCCGQGRHALLLASRGMKVTGQDLSEEYLTLAAKAAAAGGIEIETVHSDMRLIPFEARFDAVINMFSAFGYLEDEAEDAKVLAAVSQALKPGGRLLMDLLNREWVMGNVVPHDWHTGEDGTLYLEHREVDLVASRNHVSFTAIAPDGSRREIAGHHFRLYTLTELVKMLSAVGLEFARAYGGFEGEDYGIGTRRMIVVARKSA